jgi:hypothetical protein
MRQLSLLQQRTTSLPTSFVPQEQQLVYLFSTQVLKKAVFVRGRGIVLTANLAVSQDQGED